MRRFSITVPTEVVSVCRTGAPPETSTTLVISPTSKVKSIRLALPTWTVISLRSIARNPDNSTLRS